MKAWCWVVGSLLVAQALACDPSSEEKSDDEGHGGANATGGSTSTGGAAGATGGSTSTGGTAGAPGGSSTTGGTGAMGGGSPHNGAPVSPLCDAYAMHVKSECPTSNVETTRYFCSLDYAFDYPIGCTTELDERLRCEIEAPINCEDESPTGCLDADEALQLCEIGFYTRTRGCNPDSNSTGDCPAGQFAFYCTVAVPTECTVHIQETIGTNACCPRFLD